MDLQQRESDQPAVRVAGSCPVLCSLEYGSTDSSPVHDSGSCTHDNADSEQERDSGSQEMANSGSASASAGCSSPDLTCPICLGRLENRSYTDTCFHKFCFVCLVEWSKVKPVCPLCKQSFTSIIHNVQSYEKFEQLPITPGNAEISGILDTNRNRFRYPTTVIHGRSERRRQRELLQRPSRIRRRGSSRFDIPPPAFTSSYRRSIYRDDLWVRRVEDSGCYRDTSAVFYARNQVAIHRLMPWLNRELMALLRNPADVTFLLEVILSTVQRVDITSETFHDLVAPFLGARTRHFVYEFYTFARSPFNMEAYDTRAVYDRRPQVAATSPIEFSDSSDSDQSEAEIVEINPPAGNTIPESQQELSGDESPMNEEDWTRDRWSPQPGPSGLHLMSPSLDPIHSVQSTAQEVSAITSQLGSNSVENVNEDSDGGIEIVAEDKPWKDRSPVVLSSDSEADATSADLLCQASATSLITDNRNGEHSLTADSGSTQQHICIVDHHSDRTEVTNTSCHAEGPEKFPHHVKRTKKHKHKRHSDSSHQSHSCKSHSSSSGQHITKKHRSRAVGENDELKHLSSAADLTQRELDHCKAEEPAWASDDSSDAADSNRVRSVVVVPQNFKKHASGHKRSTRDQS